MPDFNDVVRHIILRIVVDSAGLAEELAKTRGQLKAAEAAEKESNKARSKDAEQVTKAYEKQNDALRDNIAAHDQLSKSSDKNADRSRERIRESTKDIQDSTKAQTAQIAAIEGQKDKAHQRTLARYKAEQAAQLAYDKGIAESAEKMSREQQSLNQTLAERRSLASDASQVRRGTQATRIETEQHINRETGRNATNIADQSEYAADIAKTNALEAADQRVTDSVRRRRSLISEEKASRERLNILAQQGAVLEQRALSLAEQRAKSEERTVTTRRRGLGASLAYAASTVGDVAIGLGRAAISAPRSAARAGRDFDSKQFDDAGTAASRAEKTIAAFFTSVARGGEQASTGISRLAGSFKALSGTQILGAGSDRKLASLRVEGTLLARSFEVLESAGARVASAFRGIGGDADSNVRRVQRFRAQIVGFFEDINRARAGGQGGSLFSDFVGKGVAGLQALDGAFSGVSRHLISFQNLIFLIVAAFGPLAAILGGLGAAALGLASNLVSLAGSLAALPGIISAAVAAFGALYIAVKPLTNIFTAYQAAQKAAAAGTAEASRAAVTAANAVQDAQRRLTDATIAHTRAVEDAPRAEQKLSDARKQAKREIEDLRAAYQKLKYDEEGAQLDVDSAEQAYKRALVDPSSNRLARRQARHDVEGALFDQRDQNTTAQRTQEDYAEAMQKGVEGMDAVVSALRGVEDANRAISDTLTDQTRAQQDLSEAQKDAAAGGSAARTAQEAYQAELKKAAPELRTVALAILGLGDAWKDMQKRFETKVFGPLSQDTDKFKTVLEELETFLGPTADAFGLLADQALGLLTNPDWNRFFAQQGEANAGIIADLGGAALDAADGFRAIIEIARPFTEFVTNGIANMAKSFDDFANSKEGRKEIAGFLDITKQRMGEIGKVIGNLVGGFAGFFKALSTPAGGKEDFTSWFNKGLINATASFKTLGEEASNPNSGFRKWLENVKPLLSSIKDFLGDVVEFFGNLFSDPDNLKEAEKLLGNIGGALKTMGDVFDDLSKSGIISKVAEAIKTVADTLKDIGEGGGFKALSIFGEAMKAVVGVVDLLVSSLSHIPGLLEGIGITIGVLFGAALLKKIISPIIGLIQFGRNAIRSIPNPDNADTSTDDDGKSTKTKPQQVGRQGGQGVKGSGRDTSTNSGTVERLNQRSQRKGREWTVDRDSSGSTSRLQRLRDRLPGGSRRDTSTGTSSTRPSRAQRAINAARTTASTVSTNAKNAVLGDTKVEPTLGRMENLLKQIERNTRKRGGGTSSSGSTTTGGGGGGGSDDDGRTKPKPTSSGGGGTTSSTGGKSSRHRTTTTSTSLPTLFDDSIPAKPGRTKRGTTRPTISIDTDSPLGTSFPGRVTPNATSGDVVKPGSTTFGPEINSANPYVSKKTGPYVDRDDPTGTNVARTTALPAQTAQNVDRNKARKAAGLSPLDDSYTSARRASTTGITSTTPIAETGYSTAERRRRVTTAIANRAQGQGANVPSFSTYLDDDKRARYEKVLDSRNARRAGGGTVPRLDFTEDKTYVSPAEKERRLTAVAESSANRKTVPTFDENGNPVSARRTTTTTADLDDTGTKKLPVEPTATTAQVNNRRSASTETAAQRRKRLAKERAAARNQGLNDDRRTTSTTAAADEDDETPAKKPKRNAKPEIDVNETHRPTSLHPSLADEPVHTVATADEVDGPVKPTRDSSGKITSPYPADVDRTLGTPAANFPGQQRPTKEKTRRNAQTRTTGGRFGSRKKPNEIGSGLPDRPVLADVEPDDDRSKPKSTFRERAKKLGFFPKSDEGSAPAGLLLGGASDTDDDDKKSTRRAKTTGGKPSLLSRFRGKKKPTGFATPFTAGIDALTGGDDEYEDGYEDGLAASGGGNLPGGDKKQSRKEKRAARKAAKRSRRGRSTGALDLLDDFEDVEDDFDDDSGRRGKTTGGRARGGRLGGALKGLGGKFGGSLGRGLLGGGVAALAGGALQLGGDAVINKFVKNDKDRASLSGGLSAVTTGASLGAMFGPAGAVVGGALGGVYALFKDKNLRDFVEKKLGKLGELIVDGLKAAGSWIAGFFTKTIPGWWSSATKPIGKFFTDTLPKFASKAFHALLDSALGFLKFWYIDLPLKVAGFFVGLGKMAVNGFKILLGYALDFLKFWYIDLPLKVLQFFTQTLPKLASEGWQWLVKNLGVPLAEFITKKVPQFFTDTIPHWFESVGHWFGEHVVSPLTDFFTKKIPSFFTDVIPNAIKSIGGFFNQYLIEPVKTFFGHFKDVSFFDLVKNPLQIIDWAKDAFFGGGEKKMSGGLIQGIYQGIQDKAHVWATPGEFMFRKSVVDEPGAKAIMSDWNEGRIKVSDLVGGLAASTAPQVRSIVPPGVQGMTGAVPTVVNNTVNHAPLTGDITIHNPVREASDRSLRRQLQVAANRHRR